MRELLPLRSVQEIQNRPRSSLPAATLSTSAEIIRRIETGGAAALRELGEEFDGLAPGDPLVLESAALQSSLADLPAKQRDLLERTETRIQAFASAQLESLQEFSMPIPGGRAGQKISPMQRVGCYVPAGRHALPSSLLMGVCTAKIAGVEEIWVASPRPGPLIKAAAALAGASSVLCLGGAQAIAAMALGAGPVPGCDIVVGPGNAWVTAAKQLLAGRVAIDMLAGPSELLIIADQSANPEWVAADLIAQAEHDALAQTFLLSDDQDLIDRVRAELEHQLDSLATADVARESLSAAAAVKVDSLQEATAIADAIAPEHLQLMTADPRVLSQEVHQYGSLFIGAMAAEVFGDYGAGPNHVLPTEGRARQRGGLSVFDFLRVRSWMELESGADLSDIAGDAADLAAMEGLPGHAHAARLRAEFTEGASPIATRP